VTDMSTLLIETVAAAAAVLLTTTGLFAVCAVTFTTAFLMFRCVKAVIGARRGSGQSATRPGPEASGTYRNSP